MAPSVYYNPSVNRAESVERLTSRGQRSVTPQHRQPTPQRAQTPQRLGHASAQNLNQTPIIGHRQVRAGSNAPQWTPRRERPGHGTSPGVSSGNFGMAPGLANQVGPPGGPAMQNHKAWLNLPPPPPPPTQAPSPPQCWPGRGAETWAPPPWLAHGTAPTASGSMCGPVGLQFAPGPLPGPTGIPNFQSLQAGPARLGMMDANAGLGKRSSAHNHWLGGSAGLPTPAMPPLAAPTPTLPPGP